VEILLDLKTQLANNLIRKASVKCSRWAENYVILGKPKPGRLSFKWHPWEKEMMDCEENWSGRKAAQMGYTNVSLCRGIHANDIRKIDVLYLLPKRSPDASDFSKAKFDSLLELSPHLSNLYSNARNIGHKQAGSVNFFIRGARSRSGLKSISTGVQVWDELDEMPVKQLSLAIERSSGYDEDDTQLIKISTPTIPDFGIDAEIKRTDQSVFVFRCPSCSRRTHLPFPDCLKITADSLDDEANLRNSYIFCPLCKNKLNHEAKPEFLSLSRGAKWEPQVKGFYTRGFLINQYYSMVVPPWKIATSYLKGQIEEADLQEYWNSKGGLAHMPEGARVNAEDIKACFGTHRLTDITPRGQLITMGIDVGRVLHYWIDQWLLPESLGADLNMYAKCRNLKHGFVNHFEELDQIMSDYQVVHSVIDWQPEERASHNFCQRNIGRAHRCYFHRGTRNKAINVNESLIGVGRTSWLDLSQGRFKGRTIILPYDMLTEAKNHLMNLVRIQKKDKDENPVSKYISVGTDHYAFARMYSEVALPLAISAAKNEDVSAFL
jgi:hypothetical protein